ncbi:MAG: DEAD/DEAH box helicase family protein [Enterococcus sp.]|nr:DEAD/DEAH box helicase family protein [Enterococcus sp.]
MLKSNVHWSPHRQYKSKTEWEPLGFFSDCLCNSTRFDLILGFFSSSAIRTLADAFALFLYNGGTMRLIINNILSPQDKNSIIAASNDNLTLPFDLTNIEKLRDTLSTGDKHFFECLSWLIANKRIDIKIIVIRNEQGIAHTKEGIFSDGQNFVAFNGSCNFTQTALIGNKESIFVSCDWDSEPDKNRVNYSIEEFEKTFSGKDDSVIYVEPTEIITNIEKVFGDKSIEELLKQEERLLCEKSKVVRTSIKKVLVKVNKKIEKIIQEAKEEEKKPKFPYPYGAREYQQTAFENWKNNNQQGLFAMATGTGKTITSLNCLLEIYKKTCYYKALILVPTITLVNQWENECRNFNFENIIKVCSKSPSWKDDIAGILLQERLRPTEQVSFIVIATYASFSRPNIFGELNQLPVKTLLIADECHNMGSATILNLLPKVNCKRRIGLSATPERQFDEEGNYRLFSFFNSENGYIYEYSMQEAINNGVLCRYYYYPHLVSLTDVEIQDYLRLSEKISRFYNSNSDSFKSDPILTALLLARKRIIHKAFNKVEVFNSILRENYNRKNSLKYTLVYVPEGNDTNDYFENDFFSENDEIISGNDAIHLIDVFTKAVRDIDNRITVQQFVSGISERDEILEQFAKGEIDVLASMKCLDEGVDVPRAELAIFCASTGNPRQFVQRRGRILRQHPDKQFAFIHDLVVIPKISSHSDGYPMERNMLKKELERVNNFASLSENSSYTLDVLLDTMNYYNLNLYNND